MIPFILFATFIFALIAAGILIALITKEDDKKKEKDAFKAWIETGSSWRADDWI